MRSKFLPYGRQSIDESDIAAVAGVLRGDWLTTGPAVEAFEDEFARVTGTDHAIACSNGTAALHLALAAHGITTGDVCIVPAITFMATANAALYCGADVVFADVDSETGLMTPQTLKTALIKARGVGRIRAVLPVHLAGQCEDIAAMRAQAQAAGAVLVEDACHALGTVYKGDPVGQCRDSDAACFSFHPVKTIAAGEGGMVTVRDAELAHRLRSLRSHGIERDAGRLEHNLDQPWWHEMQSLGWNYRLSDIQAALARSQLSRLDQFAAKRRSIASRYDALLENQSAILPLARTPDCDPCLHLYPVRIDFSALGTSRADVMTALKSKGIGTQVHYIPVPSQPWYRARYGEQTPPGAASYYERTLSLPLFAGMDDSDPERVISALEDVLGD
jgi:UDP-4-amino-4,6-dideoxy-N-acetyl-beta-L-altrosamine transaminase